MNNFKPVRGERKKEEGRWEMGGCEGERVGGSIYMYMKVGCWGLGAHDRSRGWSKRR